MVPPCYNVYIVDVSILWRTVLLTDIYGHNTPPVANDILATFLYTRDKSLLYEKIQETLGKNRVFYDAWLLRLMESFRCDLHIFNIRIVLQSACLCDMSKLVYRVITTIRTEIKASSWKRIHSFFMSEDLMFIRKMLISETVRAIIIDDIIAIGMESDLCRLAESAFIRNDEELLTRLYATGKIDSVKHIFTHLVRRDDTEGVHRLLVMGKYDLRYLQRMCRIASDAMRRIIEPAMERLREASKLKKV